MVEERVAEFSNGRLAAIARRVARRHALDVADLGECEAASEDYGRELRGVALEDVLLGLPDRFAVSVEPESGALSFAPRS